MTYQIILGDCVKVMRAMEENSVDAIVTDPPYELGFMGKAWDSSGIAYSVEMWREAWRVLKPGGHLLAFSGSRTYHRMACAIEDAGFEIRDQIMWLYGSGFPKSLDVSKAIDKASGAERQVTRAGQTKSAEYAGKFDQASSAARERRDIPATDAARQWQGWGTALKPAHEPIVVARKPLVGTVAANVLAHGTGALNIDGCRIPSERQTGLGGGAAGGNTWNEGNSGLCKGGEPRPVDGRWPANVIHDGSDEVTALFPQTTSGGGPKPGTPRTQANTYGKPTISESAAYGSNTGSAARFFYCAKASKADRNSGGVANTHPTVKPVELMRYLCRLVTPPGGVVLDPFMGSGSTGKAAMLEGFRFIGVDMVAEHTEIARGRITHAAEMALPKPEEEQLAPKPSKPKVEKKAKADAPKVRTDQLELFTAQHGGQR